MSCDTAKSRVFPYVDGELDGALRAEMDAHLAACPSCRRLVEAEVAFHEAYIAPLRPDPAPACVRDAVTALTAELLRERREVRRGRRVRRAALALAATVLFALGVSVGIGVQSVRGTRAMLAELTEASVLQHQRLVQGLLPPDIVGVSPKHAEAWFRSRLSFNVSLPELKNENLTLLGARISHLASIEVAALEYRVDDKNVSLFVLPEDAYARLRLSAKPKFKVLRHRGYDVIMWQSHGTAYTLVSEIGGRSCLVCHARDERLDASLDGAHL